MFDRRRIVGLVALSIALAGSISLSALAWSGFVTPVLLLVACFIIGSGMALFGPAWQASVSEQVPAEALPSAVALNGISYNIARSFGPAIGGIIVASAGAVAAFATNALLYLPLLIVLFLWRRVKEPLRLPPERMARAVISGVPLHRALAANSNCARADLGYRNRRRFRLSAHADCHARSSAWRSANVRRHAGDIWHGRGDRSAQYFCASRAFGRRSFDPSVHDRYGRLCRCRRDQPLASANRDCARLRRRRLDRFGHGVQCRCSTCCSAVGRRSRARGLPSSHFRWDCTRQLGVGQHSERRWRRRSAAHFGRERSLTLALLQAALHFIAIVDDERPMAIADEGDRRIPAGDGLSKIPTLTLTVGVVLDDLGTLRARARNRQDKGFSDDRQT